MLRRNRVSTCVRVQSERKGLQEGGRKCTGVASGQAFEKNAVPEMSSPGKATNNKNTPFIVPLQPVSWFLLAGLAICPRRAE